MNFEKIRSDVERKKEITDFFLKEEKRGEFYPAYDCDLKDFNSRFDTVLRGDIPDYLNEIMEMRKVN